MTDYNFVLRVIAIVKGLLVTILILSSWFSFLASIWLAVAYQWWQQLLGALFWGVVTMLLWVGQLSQGKK